VPALQVAGHAPSYPKFYYKRRGRQGPIRHRLRRPAEGAGAGGRTPRLQRGDVGQVRPSLGIRRVASGRDPSNAQAWADLAYVTALQARGAPARAGALGRSAEAVADRALAASPFVIEFWIRRGVARDLQGRH